MSQKCQHQTTPVQTTLAIILTKTLTSLSQLLYQQNQYILKYHKHLSKNIQRLTKYRKIIYKNIQLNVLYKQCIQLLIIFILSSEYQKYGHLFVGFEYIVRGQVVVGKIKLDGKNQNIVQGRFQDNQKYYKQHTIKTMSQNQINMLSLPNLTSYLIQLSNTQISNSSCINCSRIFIKQHPISHRNQIYKICQLNITQYMDNKLFSKYICAVCNEGGGVILLGTYHKHNALYAKGIKFKAMEQMEKFQYYIQEVATQVRPSCYIRIDKIAVYPNFVNYSTKNMSTNKIRICFRLLVYPIDTQKISYIRYSNKGYQKDVFEIYKFNANKKLYKVISAVENGQVQNIYTVIHDRYQCKPKQVNIHQNIRCCIPYSINKMYFNNTGNAGQQSESSSLQQKALPSSQSSQLLYKYKNGAMLIVGAAQNLRYIDQLQVFLKKMKQLYCLQKPYGFSFEGTARSIYLVTFQRSYNYFKSIFKQFQNKYKLKQGCIIVMPVCRCIQLQSNKISQNQLKKICHKYTLKFNKQCCYKVDSIMQKNGQFKEYVIFNFVNQKQAIFVYMIFQQLQLRPYFSKVK